MQRHESYKPSGAEWLGDIPRHWTVTPAKRLFREVSEKNHPDAELLSVTQEFGVIPRDRLEQRVVMPTGQLQTFKLVREDDFVISLRSFQGGIEYSEFTGLVSPAYTILRKQKEANSRYLKHLLKSAPFISELNTSVTGIREGKNISFSEMAYSLMPLPTASEQARIADFLDLKTTEIDTAIAKKERLIELLLEQKDILINQAVTQGLDSSAPKRDSGVAWIGQVPAHWRQTTNRTLFRERMEPGHADLPILSVSLHTGVSDEEQDVEENIRAKIRIEDKTSYKRVRPGDVTYNMMRAWQGAIGVVRVDGLVSPAYVVAAPLATINGAYFEYLYRTHGFIREMDRYSKGITDFRKRLYWDEFKQLVSLLPPLDEQVQIAAYAEQVVKKTAALTEKIRGQIDALNKFRASLIENLVTGKIKV